VPSRDIRSANRSSNWTARAIGAKRFIVLLERSHSHLDQ
jgi:hypothetical protein